VAESLPTLLLLWGGLVALLTGGVRWLQTSIYSEPAAGLIWRGPLAATLLTLLLAAWGYMDSTPPGQYSSFFTFSPGDLKEYSHLRAVVLKDGKETSLSYRLRKSAQGGGEYREINSPYRPLPRRPEAIFVEEDGQEIRFEPQRQADRKLKVDFGQALRYVDNRGRVMSEDSFGRVTTFRWGTFLAYATLNVTHFLLWFGCFWLILRFQWSHALGLTAVAWMVMTFVLVPLYLHKVEEAAARTSLAMTWLTGPVVPSRTKECA
jgi:hypothetical protein